MTFSHLVDSSKALMGLLSWKIVLRVDANYFDINKCNLIWPIFQIPSRRLFFLRCQFEQTIFIP